MEAAYMSLFLEVRLTATRNVTIFPAFSWAGSETPGSRFTIRITAVIHLQILLWKTEQEKYCFF